MLTGVTNGNERALAWVGGGRVSLLAAFVASLGGALVLAGWVTDTEMLKRIQPGLVAMNPMTASCLLLAGLAIACHQFRRPRLGLAVGMLMVLAACAKVLDFAVGGVPVDQLLFAGSLDGAPGTQPNRMAPNTVAALLLVGLSLVFVASQRRGAQVAAQSLALAVMLISIFALIGYAFGMDRLTAVGPFPWRSTPASGCWSPASASSPSAATRR